MNSFDGQIIVSRLLPIEPTLEEDVIRQVRHGLADVLEWLGEDVGPQPGAKTHIIVAADISPGLNTIFVSPELNEKLKNQT